jgi:hypothetical protein
MWHAGTHLRLASGYANADCVTWEPDKPQGLSLRPSGGDGVWEQRTIDGTPAVISTPNPHSQTTRYLYLNADDAFAYNLLDGSALLRVTYCDIGCAAFGVEYDSTVDEGPLDGAFRPADSVRVSDSGQWKTAQIPLPNCRFMNRCNGADLRLAVTGREINLTIRRVQIEKVK